jgi:CRP/FNR family transcriptional regulator
VVTLERSKLFGQLPAHELKALQQIVSEVRFSAGSEIFKEGDRGDGMYVVKEGLVEISALLNTQVRHVFSQVGPGEMFGKWR